MLGERPRLSFRVRVDGHAGHPPRLDATFESAAAITAIMGPSGAGKTTLLECVAGLVRPASGRIVIDDTPVFDSESRLFISPHRRKVARRVRRDTAMAWLERARAGALARRAPATLSGGEAQRVALARALASEPRLLLLDEPFSALNQELRLELGEVLRELLTSARVPALLVTHDLADAERLASRILALDTGRIVADKSLAHVPATRKSSPLEGRRSSDRPAK
jgi:molybdate transport system ATP-binding protein